MTIRVLTWHVHGSYLYYLSHVPVHFYLPVKPGRPQGYGGRAGHFPWPDNVHEVPADEIAALDVDCVLFQSRRNYLEDQHELLTAAQRGLPRIYLEHDPPREHPTDTRHVLDDPDALLVHVTAFNDLMWDSGATPTRVIRHGVTVPEGLRHTAELERGIVVVNNIASRGRRTGHDLFDRARERVPLDLAGMGSEELGGLGDVPLGRLMELQARYRFFFHPIRYTSLGLAVCEAMMLGLPVVGPATTELPAVIENGRSGYVDTDVERLIAVMEELVKDPGECRRLGQGARERALELFGIERFVLEWRRAFEDVTELRAGRPGGRIRVAP